MNRYLGRNASLGKKTIEMMDYVQHATTRGTVSKLSEFLSSKTCYEAIENIKKIMIEYRTPGCDSLPPDSLTTFLSDYFDKLKLHTQQALITDLDWIKSSMDETLTKKDPTRSIHFYNMASIAARQGEYDRAIEYIRDGLSIPCSDNRYTVLYEKLACIYKEQKNWRAVIASYQKIIEMPHMTSNSPIIIEAYIENGDAYSKINELPQAFDSYTKALDLQRQHYPDDHERTSRIYIKIGDWYKQLGDMNTAVEYYQRAISIDHPETTAQAYGKIGFIYIQEKKYDLARFNFIRSLEIEKIHKPQNTFSFAVTYSCLIIVEHDSKHHHQRDIYINELMSLTGIDEKTQNFINDQIQWTFDFINTTIT